MATGNYPDKGTGKGTGRNAGRMGQINSQKEKAKNGDNNMSPETSDNNEVQEELGETPVAKVPAKRGRKPSGIETEQLSIVINKSTAELIRLNIPSRFKSINAYINSVIEADMEVNREKYEKTAALQRQINALNEE